MARQQYKAKIRQLRSDDELPPERMPSSHRFWVVALYALTLEQGIGSYTGNWTAAGKSTLRYYQGDDPVETFITSRDDPEKVCYATAFDLFGEKVAAEWLARTRAAAAGSPAKARSAAE